MSTLHVAALQLPLGSTDEQENIRAVSALVDQAAAERRLGLLAREIDHALDAVHLGREPGLDLQLGGLLDIAQRLAVRAPALPDKQAGQQQHQ